MPTLEFKGKQFVHSHHLSVPFRQLVVDKDKSLSDNPDLDDNLIIHGDNLHALKALLPQYAGKVNCIYIDPPYNTGEEGWCYNDTVNAPLIREWLKKSANPVDKDDLERHDKWLTMMWPRLWLLKELLANDGVIFVSIDDNEYHNLKAIMDEIFGEEKHIATNVWQKRYSRENREAIGDVHEYIVVYANDPLNFKEVRNLVAATEEQLEVYRNPNNDPRGAWRPIPITAQAGHATKDQFYSITAPGGKVHRPPEGRCWGLAESTFNELLKQNRIYFGQDGNSQPNLIRYLDEVEGFVPWTWWPSNEVGHTDEAKKEIYSITGRSAAFDTPKPLRLIKRIIDIATNKNSIVLDSFAGSGTTAHAVLLKNHEDKGNRKFILVECEEYANEITAKRVRHAIRGYEAQEKQKTELLSKKLSMNSLNKADELLKKVKEVEEQYSGLFEKIQKKVVKGELKVIGINETGSEVSGLGGSFTFCELGDEINIESLLKGDNLPDYEALARYVFYTATGKTLESVAKASGDYFIGETGLYRVHLIYQPSRDFMRNNESALNAEMVERIAESNTSGKRCLVFASAKYMSQKELTGKKIDFCQLPYAIHRVLGD